MRCGCQLLRPAAVTSASVPAVPEMLGALAQKPKGKGAGLGVDDHCCGNIGVCAGGAGDAFSSRTEPRGTLRRTEDAVRMSTSAARSGNLGIGAGGAGDAQSSCT